MKLGKGFSLFLGMLHKKDKTNRIPTKREFRRFVAKAVSKRDAPTIAAIKHITSPLKPAPTRMDWSDGAETHIQRLKGERPTRALWRKMQRIRARRAS